MIKLLILSTIFIVVWIILYVIGFVLWLILSGFINTKFGDLTVQSELAQLLGFLIIALIVPVVSKLISFISKRMGFSDPNKIFKVTLALQIGFYLIYGLANGFAFFTFNIF